MPSDSVESFLDLARENRLLPNDQVQELVRQSEVPQENLAALCEALVERGLLTAFQARRIREGRGRELAFAGYPILDDLGPCPGGFALTAKHPSLRTPIILRRLSTDWLAPADNLSAFIQRAQLASTILHPNLAPLLDAGAYEDQLFVALEPYEGANLESLVRDIGPMPALLACSFARQAALGLDAIHKSGYAHGDVRPGSLYVHPLVASSRTRSDGSPILRPGPNAVVKVGEFGLVPRRPILAEWIATRPVTVDELMYLPPERTFHPTATPAGDAYGLGMTLFHLLTGRTPHAANSPAELIARIAMAEPLPLAAIRPDLPADLVGLVMDLTAADPARRPSLASAAERFAVFGTPGLPPSPVVASARPADSSIIGGEPPVDLKPALPITVNPPIPQELVARPIELTPVAAPSEWTVQPYEGSSGDGEPMFAPAAAVQPASHDGGLGDFAAPSTPVVRRRQMSAEEAHRHKRKWFLIGGGLNLLAIPLWIILLYTYGCFDSKKASTPDRPVKQKR